MKTAVFLDPITQHFRRDRLFGGGRAGHHSGPYEHVRDVFASRGIDVHTADYLLRGEHVAERNMYFSFGNLRNYKSLVGRNDVVLSGFFHIEAPIIHPTTYRDTPEASEFIRRIYSFSTPEALAPFGCGGMTFRSYRIPEPYHGIDGYEELWSRRDRKFLCMISQNKQPKLSYNELYTERLRLLEHFSRSGSIDLYGLGWDTLPFRVGEPRSRAAQRLERMRRFALERLPFSRRGPYEAVIRNVYRGPVESKHEAMSRYTFAITYENMVLDGWINEKIFDALVVGTIPIYLGAPDVTNFIPPDCFIDPRQFADYDELEAYLHSLGEREIEDYRESGRAFMSSERYRPFSKETFASIFLSAVEEDLALVA